MCLDFFRTVFMIFCTTGSLREPRPKPRPISQHQQLPQLPDQSKPLVWEASEPVCPPHRHLETNQQNQRNEFYVSLRSRANEEGEKMARSFENSHQAYAEGNGALAKQLSVEGNEHQRNMGNLHKQASDWIFMENNKEREPGEIDLHGLYVKEAVDRTETAIHDAKSRGDTQIRLIVGKGLHSQGAAKIKPAIASLMEMHQLSTQVDPANAGVLIVHINSGQMDGGANADEITRSIERNDNCVIM